MAEGSTKCLELSCICLERRRLNKHEMGSSDAEGLSNLRGYGKSFCIEFPQAMVEVASEFSPVMAEVVLRTSLLLSTSFYGRNITDSAAHSFPHDFGSCSLLVVEGDMTGVRTATL